MPDFETMYFHLFAAVSNATEALEEQDVQKAIKILIQAQLQGEVGTFTL